MIKKNETKILLRLIKERHQLRKIKRYEDADKIRKQIEKMDIRINDVEDNCIEIFAMLGKYSFDFLGEIDPEDINNI